MANGVRGTTKGKRSAKAWLVNLNELSLVTSKSENTLRSDIQRDPENYPIRKRGGNGVEWEFDARQVKRYYDARDRAEAAADAKRRDELNQPALELYGEAVTDPEAEGLSLAERQRLVEVRFKENQLAEQQGRLVRADEVFLTLRQESQAMTREIVKRFSLDRDDRRYLENLFASALNRAVDKVQALHDAVDRKIA